MSTTASDPHHLPGSEEITRSSQSNLALSFFSLSQEQKKAMTIFYAFCRVVDDVSDSETLPLEEKRRQLQEWRKEICRAFEGTAQTPLGREMAQIIHRFKVELEPLEEIINGVEMDLDKVRYAHFTELELYCYRVASAVGLVSIRIFECEHAQTRDYAIALGMALQLTNILRDVKKDASIGRIYVPLNELALFGLTEEDIMQSRWSEKMRQFVRFQHHRARHYFARAHRLMVPEDRKKLMAAEIMRAVYEEILNVIQRQNFDNLTRPVKFGKLKKARLAVEAMVRELFPKTRPPAPKKVLVLGAGFAGLAAAKELVLRGHHVTVVESRALLGGRAHSFVEPKTHQVMDNGQHILMGCYTHTLGLIRDMGVKERLFSPPGLHVPFFSPRGKSSLTARWPEPFHLVSALLGFQELTFADKWAAAKLAVRLKLGQRPDSSETVLQWLARWKQPANLIRALWEPLCLAAVNEPCASGSATLFATVIRLSFLRQAKDAKILLSRVGLSELFAPEVVRLLEMCGGTLRMQSPVKALHFKADQIHEVELASGERLTADAVVSALPWHVLRGLLPEGSKLSQACRGLEEAPIISLHLWLDRPLLTEPFVGLLDSPVHWVFNRARIHQGESQENGHVITVVISGARDQVELTAAELEALTLRELARFVPEAAAVKVLHRVIYKARSATFAATPEAEKIRPGAETEWKNFLLAGDWISTDLPATLESAIWSGGKAAAKIDAISL